MPWILQFEGPEGWYSTGTIFKANDLVLLGCPDWGEWEPGKVYTSTVSQTRGRKIHSDPLVQALHEAQTNT